MSRPNVKGSASPLSSKSSSMQDRSSPSSCSSGTPPATIFGCLEPSPWSSERPESRRSNSRDSFRLPSAPSPVNNGSTNPSTLVPSRRPNQQQQHNTAPRGGFHEEPASLQQQQQQQPDELPRPESRRSSRSRSRGVGDTPWAPPPAIEQLACTPTPTVSEALHPINPGLTFGSQLGRISAAGGFGRPASRVTPSPQLLSPGALGLFSDAMQGHAEHFARSNSEAGMDCMQASHRLTSTSPLGRMARDDALSSASAQGMGAGTGSLTDTRGRAARKEQFATDRPPRTYSYEDSHAPGMGRRSPSQQKARLPTVTRPHKLPPLHPGGA